MNRPFSILVVTLAVALGACREQVGQLPGATEPTESTPAPAPRTSPSRETERQTENEPTNTEVSAPAASGNAARLAYEENTVEVTEASRDGVVFVTSLSRTAPPIFGTTEGDSAELTPQPTGTGSGFFVDEDGFILTNHHVIEGAQQVTVRLPGSNREFPARLVGDAPEYDLALLQAQNVPDDLYDPLALADSDEVRVGEKAIALGSPFGLEFSVTQGIVSAKNRVVPIGVNNIPQNTIQTDAAINPGNSGGPLLNSAGDVMGINTLIISPGTAQTGVGQNAGIGFAIPSNTARALLPRLRAGGEVRVPRIGIVGVPLGALPQALREDLDLPASGVLIQEVTPGSPAARAGIRGGQRGVQIGRAVLRTGGDVITGIEDEEVTTVQDVQSVLVTRQPGDTVTVTVQRGGEEREVEMTLAAGGAQ